STRIHRLLEAPRSSDCWRHQGVQTAGGTKEFSVKPGAVSKYHLTDTILKADHRLFGHMVLIATSRNLI
ncbi:hypothetical protein LSAT2_016329, partial [Lamellibrachia satsuma]